MRYFQPLLLALTGCMIASCGTLQATQGRDLGVLEADEKLEAGRQAIKAQFPAWYEPTDPFRIIGDIYYVGTQGLGVYFIPTDEGHILIDGGLPETAAHVLDGIRTLGFDPADVRILLNTHAHFDHSGGLAELKEVTGAQFLASEGDRSALEGGFYLGSEGNHVLDAPPIKVDRTVVDGEVIERGGVQLTANLTPGHSRGCTSWTLQTEEASEAYEALIFCSATVAANRLTGPPQYDGIVEDYRSTFKKTADWRPDVFLSNHPEFFKMAEKRERLEAGDRFAFVDRDGFPALMVHLEEAFIASLSELAAED